MSARDAAEALLRSSPAASPTASGRRPGESNLIGEHTDYNEGFVLPFAIEHRTYAAVGAARRRRGARRLHLRREPGAGAARRPRRSSIAGPRHPGVGGLPARRRVGAAAGRRRPRGPARRRHRDRLRRPDRRRAVVVGRDRGCRRRARSTTSGSSGSRGSTWRRSAAWPRTTPSGRPTGIMDQMASMLGRADAATFLDCRTLATESVDLGFDAEGLRCS